MTKSRGQTKIGWYFSPLQLMLSRIEISNFKAIKETPLVLDGLAPVNYLVGPNGCGKSSVLEGIINNSANKSFGFNFKIRDKLFKDHLNLTEVSEENFLKAESFLKTTGFNFESKKINPDTNHHYTNFFECLKTLGINLQGVIYPKGGGQGNNIATLYFNELKKLSIKYKILTYNDFQFDELKITKDNIDKIRFNKEDPDDIIMLKFLNEYFYKNKPKLVDISIERITKEIRVLDANFNKNFIKDFATGYQNLYTLYYQIHKEVKTKTITSQEYSVIAIEEPENGLHPEYQKLLPEIFKDFADAHKVKFLISTHSPFIISAAAKEDGQKVYLIEDGKCEKSDGYVGFEMKEIANKMLGAKTTDILFEHYILCEGSTDVEILNYIFQPYKNVKFILADNKDEVNKKIAVGLILNKISDEIKISGFVDWDGDNKSTKEFKENWEEKFGLKISDTKPKQKLESFLYDKSVLEILKKDFPKIDTNREIDDKIDPNLDSFFQDSKDKKHTGHCENWFRLEWQNLGYDKFTNSNKKDFQLNKLAEIIREMGKVELNLPKEERNNIYWQLHKLIFT